MKKSTLFLLIALTGTSSIFAQKKANGTVYIEHPAIQTVEDFVKASIAGDTTRMASYLATDFVSYNGTSNIPDSKGWDKNAFLRNALRYYDELDYYAITPLPGSYPDAVEYKKDNKNEEVWVQTWDMLTGVHKETGVKIDAAAHRLYTLTKDNKIKTIISYGNSGVLEEIGASYADRTNGTIYNHHENINTVRKAMYAFEKGDLDKSLTAYADDATFNDINDDFGTSVSKADIKPVWERFLENFELKNIEMIGYPDYLEYEMGNGREVLSWWKYHLVRKSDKKPIVLFLHFSNSFNEEGKIISETLYYSGDLLKR